MGKFISLGVENVANITRHSVFVSIVPVKVSFLEHVFLLVLSSLVHNKTVHELAHLVCAALQSFQQASLHRHDPCPCLLAHNFQ